MIRVFFVYRKMKGVSIKFFAHKKLANWKTDIFLCMQKNSSMSYHLCIMAREFAQLSPIVLLLFYKPMALQYKCQTSFLQFSHFSLFLRHVFQQKKCFIIYSNLSPSKPCVYYLRKRNGTFSLVSRLT